MAIPISRFSEIYNNGSGCLSILNSIEYDEEMLELLEGLEKYVLSQGNCSAYKVMSYLAQHKLPKLLLTISRSGKYQYLNMFSSKKKYSQVLDHSTQPGSPLYVLCKQFFRKYGNCAVAIFGPLLGLPNAITDSLIVQTVFNKSGRGTYSNRGASEIYGYFCRHDSSAALLRVVEFFLSYRTLLLTCVNPLSIIWEHLEMEQHTVIVSPLFQARYLPSDSSLLTVTNSQQFRLFNQMISNVTYSDKIVFDAVSFSYDFVFSLPEKDKKSLIGRIIKHFRRLLEMHIFDPHVQPNKYKDALFETFQNVIITGKKVISRLIYNELRKCSGVRFFPILVFFGRFIDRETFVKMLEDTDLFLKFEVKDYSYDNYVTIDERFLEKTDRKVYDKSRKEAFNYFYSDVFERQFTYEQRRSVMRFASNCGDIGLFAGVYEHMALSYPMEARYYVEDKLVDCMMGRVDGKIEWKCVCHFGLRNRKKFFDQYEGFVKRYLEGVFNSLKHGGNKGILKEVENITALHRCGPRGFTSSICPLINWIQYAPYTFPVIFRELAEYTKIDSAEQNATLLDVYEEVLRIVYLSRQFPVGDAKRVKQVVEDGLKIAGLDGLQIFRKYLATLILRYRIAVENEAIISEQPFFEYLYTNCVLSPSPKYPIDLCDALYKCKTFWNDFELDTILYFYEYYTEQTKEKLLDLAHQSHLGRASLKTSRLSVYMKNIKKHENEIVREISKFYFYDELIDYVGVTEHPDLSKTAKLRILAHWFFVDEFQEFSEYASTAFLIGVCRHDHHEANMA
jgi:hypothetical protein